MTRIGLDPETNIVKEQFAVVYAPTRRDAQVSREAGSRERPRRSRDRFPDNCVQVVASREAALAQADVKAKRFPAIVLGPSRSSEGLMLYYLVQWLDEGV
jgi:hypothetical protein